MSRILQNDRGKITETIGKKIEKIICVSGEDAKIEIFSLLLIWLKLKSEQCWYRLFLDAGCCFCERYDNYQEIYLEDTQDNPIYDLSDRFKIEGLTIISAVVSPLRISGVKLEIVLETQEKMIMWCNSIDSESNFSYLVQKNHTI
ncbi:MAG: hypothetical protein ACRC80_16695 [Waterburya sp.]